MMTDLSKVWGFIRLRFEVRSPDGGPTARHLMVGSTSAWTIKTRQLRRHQSNNGPWHGHGSFALQVSNFLGLLHGQLLRINFQIGQKAETRPGHRSSHLVFPMNAWAMLNVQQSARGLTSDACYLQVMLGG